MPPLSLRRTRREPNAVLAAATADAQEVPRARRTPLSGPNAVLAAATIGAVEVSRAKQSGAWQQQAWDYYDAIGELRYIANLVGNSLSRATLFIAKAPEDGGQPERSDDQRANDALAALAGGVSGQAEMLKTFGVHLTIAGDSYLVGFDDPAAGGTQRWVVRSPEEVSAYPGTVSVMINGRSVSLPEDDVAVVRIWRPHPRRSWEADSPTRGVLPVLHELERLTQMVLASANSRLAGAGLLILPAEFDFPSPAGYPQVEDGVDPQPVIAQKTQAFVNKLGHAMVTPVTNRADPNAVVPVVITAPGEHIANIRLITFWTGLDANSIDLRKEAIRRVALGMDMPPEVLLGLGGLNHWNAWMVDEAAVKLHLEPLLVLICDALTVGYLRPLLGDDTDLMIWFETSELVQRPNRGPDAKELYDRYELSGEDLRREHGFTESSKPSDEEINDRLVRNMVAQGGAQMATDAAIQMGIFEAAEEPAPTPVPEPSPPAAEDSLLPPEAETPAGTPDEPGPPDTLTASTNGSVGAQMLAPVLVAHALDYVGKRWLKGQPRGAYPKGLPARRIHEQLPIPPDKVDALLAGAFDFLAGSVPPHTLHAVAAYVRHLAVTGTAYDPAQLITALSAAAKNSNRTLRTPART